MAIALNRLAARIIDLLHAEREAVADLSHRLRTPVTALRLDVEALPPGAERDRLDGRRRFAHAVDRRRDHARRAADPRGDRRRCDATAVVADRIAFWSALAEDEDRSVPDRPARPARSSSPAPAPTSRATVDALLGNVFAHTPAGTPFSVALATEPTAVQCCSSPTPARAGGWLTLRRAVAPAAGSTGLGLDIAAPHRCGLRRWRWSDTSDVGGGAVVVVAPAGDCRSPEGRLRSGSSGSTPTMTKSSVK